MLLRSASTTLLIEATHASTSNSVVMADVFTVTVCSGEIDASELEEACAVADVPDEFVEALYAAEVVRFGRACQQFPTGDADSPALATKREGRSQAVCQHAISSVAVQHGIVVCVAHSGAMVEPCRDSGAMLLSIDV